MLYWDVEVSEFITHSFVHFQIDTPGKGMNILYPSSELKNTIPVLLQRSFDIK